MCEANEEGRFDGHSGGTVLSVGTGRTWTGDLGISRPEDPRAPCFAAEGRVTRPERWLENSAHCHLAKGTQALFLLQPSAQERGEPSQQGLGQTAK